MVISELLKLLLPEQGDNYNVDDFNANWLALEKAYQKLEQAIASGGNNEYIAVAMLGAALGVAQLDKNKKLISEQLPDHVHTADKITETEESKVMKAAERTQLAGLKFGIAGGIPQLDSKIRIPLDYLYAAVAGGLATLDNNGVLDEKQLPDHTHEFNKLGSIPEVFPPASHKHTESDFEGILPVEKGGTGKTTVEGIIELLGLPTFDWSTISVTTADWPSDAEESVTMVEVELPGDTGFIVINFGTQRIAWGYLIGGMFFGQSVQTGSSGGTYSWPICSGKTVKTYRGDFYISGNKMNVVYSSRAATGTIYFLKL